MSWASRVTAAAHLPQITVTTEHVTANQQREFVTAANSASPSRPRSLSVSTAHGTRQVTTTIYPPTTVLPEGRTDVSYGSVIRGDDTHRTHTHPGGTPHTPGSGLVSGSTSTPSERARLNAAGTATTLGPWTRRN